MSDRNIKKYDVGMIQLTTNQEKKGPKINGNFAYPQLEESLK